MNAGDTTAPAPAPPVPAPPTQAPDDQALLEQMMADVRAAPEQYRPTNYWAFHERHFLPLLRDVGLKDFRRSDQRKGGFASFGALDYDDIRLVRRLDDLGLFENRLVRKVPSLRRRIRRLSDSLEARCRNERFDVDAYRRLWFEFVRRQGELAGAVPLEELDVSLVGNPADSFDVGGNTYTRSLLYYYLRYAFVSGQLDLSDVSVVAELGSGSGKQAEVLHKLHPHLTLLLFDIPPPLYVANQYLRTVFPDDVVPYDQARQLTFPDDLAPGKIYLFGSWMFPLIERVDVDLFWNGASLQEMEPDVVENYLSSAGKAARHVYLMEAMAGRERAPEPGKAGVLEPVTIDHYRRYLPGFELVADAPARRPDGTVLPGPDYRDSFWSRAPEAGTVTRPEAQR